MNLNLDNADFLLTNSGSLSVENFKKLYNPQDAKMKKMLPHFLEHSIAIAIRSGDESKFKTIDYILEEKLYPLETSKDTCLYSTCYMHERGLEVAKKLLSYGIKPTQSDAKEILRYNLPHKSYYIDVLLEHKVQPSVSDLIFFSVKPENREYFIRFLQNDYDFNSVSQDKYKQTLLEKICRIFSPVQLNDELIAVFIKGGASIDFIGPNPNMVEKKILDMYRIFEENRILEKSIEEGLPPHKKLLKL